MQVAVILKHTRVNHLREADAVKRVEVRHFKCLGDFDRAVAAEVKQDYAVAVFDRSQRLSVFSDDKARQILI